MACLEMYNSNGGGGCGTPMSPRISFSNDFVEIRPEMTKTTRSSPLSKSEASENFEFSVSNYTMMPADELFSKGKLLPFKDTNQVQRTLREELLVGEDEEEEGPRDASNIFSLRPPIFSSSSSYSSSKGRWKGLLGLKRAHAGSKNNEERFVHLTSNKQSHKDAMGGREGSSCREMKKNM